MAKNSITSSEENLIIVCSVPKMNRASRKSMERQRKVPAMWGRKLERECRVSREETRHTSEG